MPKPKRFPTKVLIGFDDRQLAQIDDWRRQQAELPSRSEAIRRLVDKALATTGPKSAPGVSSKPVKAGPDDAPPKSKAAQIAELRKAKKR